MKLFFRVLLLLTFSISSANASSGIGLYIGGDYNYHLHSCFFVNGAGYDYSATGPGLSIEGFFKTTIAPFFKSDIRIGYIYFGAKETESFKTRIHIDGEESIGARVDMPLKVEISALRLTPSILYYPSNKLSVSLGFGLSYIVYHNYEIYEKLIPSQTGVLEKDRELRNYMSGDIENINSIQYSAIAGIAYGFKLDKNLFLSPEFRYCYPLNGLIENADYDIHVFQVGVSIEYDID